jgi:hypothetical protein
MEQQALGARGVSVKAGEALAEFLRSQMAILGPYGFEQAAITVIRGFGLRVRGSTAVSSTCARQIVFFFGVISPGLSSLRRITPPFPAQLLVKAVKSAQLVVAPEVGLATGPEVGLETGAEVGLATRALKEALPL